MIRVVQSAAVSGDRRYETNIRRELDFGRPTCTKTAYKLQSSAEDVVQRCKQNKMGINEKKR